MFTSNGKNIFCKRDLNIHLNSSLIKLANVTSCSDLNRGYNEDIVGKPPSPTCHSSQPNFNYNHDQFDQRFLPQSSSNRECDEDQDQRTIRLENGSKRIYGKDRAYVQGSCIKQGVLDEGSLVSNDYEYIGSSRLAKTPSSYLKVPSELKKPSYFSKTLPEFTKIQSHGGHQSYNNQLLNLRATLNEKVLQLVELQEQHVTVFNQAANACHNWKEALKSKDRIILQLQRELQQKKSQFDRFYF